MSTEQSSMSVPVASAIGLVASAAQARAAAERRTDRLRRWTRRYSSQRDEFYPQIRKIISPDSRTT
jgi:hypothetical protein